MTRPYPETPRTAHYMCMGDFRPTNDVAEISWPSPRSPAVSRTTRSSPAPVAACTDAAQPERDRPARRLAILAATGAVRVRIIEAIANPKHR